jgi:hypothetical protein
VSFPEFFLDQESLGVVGTLCDISDDVAAHFAAVFYEALLRGRTVGRRCTTRAGTSWTGTVTHSGCSTPSTGTQI